MISSGIIENMHVATNLNASAACMQVSSVWSEVLGIPQAQLRLGDNFFELGGTSATAVAVIARLQVSDQPLAVDVCIRS